MNTDDPENLFAFSFKTLPSDSTGVAHILEHTVLCGSRHFPVKDPFIRLVQGSLKTFVNAMTYPDKTVYPAASTVEQDLFNIMQVYGDAVFFPLLKESFFKQEGHRLQFDGEGKLELTGIVYNEMKGNYADHDNIVGRSVHRLLLPNTVYGHDAGGDPASIPDLAYEDFLGFHRTYYHPSNARIFLYGDIPSDRYLDFLNREFLSHFERLEPGTQIERQPRWGEPREQVITCPADGESGTTTITVSWLLDSEPDERSMLEFELLSYILLGSSAGPLRKRLIESGLGDDLSAASGTETGLREMVFSAGLRGTSPDKREEVASLVLDSLRAIADEGISAELVEASLRKVEFRHREIKGGIPNGLRFMDRSLRGWLHGRAPYETLHFEDPFGAIRAAIKPGARFFEKLIENHLLKNQHRLLTVVRPDPEHREREQAQVAARLADIESGFSEEDRERLRSNQRELEELQSAADSPEAIASLPFLKTSDLPRELENIPTEEDTLLEEVSLYSHDVFTNGIVYLDLSFDITGLDPQFLAYVPLYADVVGELGLPGKSYDEVVTEIAMKTGGFSSTTEVGIPLHEVRFADRRVVIRVKMLEQTIPEAVDLVRDLLLKTSFDNHERLAEIIKEARSNAGGSVIPGGHHFAAVRSSRGLSDADRYEEIWQGATQLLFLHELKEVPIDEISGKLAQINEQVIRRGNMTVNLTAPTEMSSRSITHIERLVGAIPEGGWGSRVDEEGSLDVPPFEALIVPADVNYVAQSFRGSRIGEAEYLHEQVLSHILRTGPLWESIRMKGGAYGASASARGMDAVFGFWSYRDPQITATLAAYRTALEELASEPVPAEALDLAIIGVTGRYIKPLSPSEKSMVSLRRTLYGISDELRLENYHTLLRTTPKQLQSAAERLLESLEHATVTVVGGSEAVSRASETYPGLAENQLRLPM